jgi:hypothetical protein
MEISKPAVSNEVLYDLKASAVPTQRSRINVYPTNKSSSFSPGDGIYFNLPILPNSYLDGANSYLRLEVKVATGANTKVRVDNNAGAFIQKYEEYSGNGDLITTISNYNELVAILFDLGYGIADRQGFLSATEGTEELREFDSFSGTDASATATIAAIEASDLTVNFKNNPRQGQYIDASAADQTRVFCLPVVSPLFSLQHKYFPIHKLSQEPRLEFTLADVLTPLVNSSDNAFTWTVTDAQLVCDYVIIKDAQLVNSITPSEVVICSSNYRCYSNSLTTSMSADTFQTLQIPCRASSVKSMLFSCRGSYTGSNRTYNVSSRINPFKELQLNIGGILHPSKPLKATTSSVAEITVELQKAVNSFSPISFYNGSLPNSYLTVNTTATNTTTNSYKNGALAGLNMESYQKSNVMLSGTNLAGQLTFLQLTVLTTPTTTYQLNTFVSHDQLLIIDSDGKLSSRW